MTITLQASEFVLQVLDAAGIRYVIEDPALALAEERERGKKFKEGSPKHQQHITRLRALEATQQPERVRVDKPAPTMAATLTQIQADAVGALVALQGVARSVAEKMIQQCDGRTADEIVTQALRKAS